MGETENVLDFRIENQTIHEAFNTKCRAVISYQILKDYILCLNDKISRAIEMIIKAIKRVN